MKISRLSKIFILPLALLFAGTPLWAANKHSVNENFATLQAFGNSVYWSIHPSVRFDSISVTLSSSTGTQSVIVADSEPSTGALDDGDYNYELVVTPSLGPSIRSELKAARQAAADPARP